MFSKQFLLLLVTVSLVWTGCASSSSADKESDAASESVSGQPPSAEEDTPKPLPKGPEVQLGSAQTDGEQKAEEAVGGDDGEDAAEAGAVVSRAELDRFIDKGPPFALTMVKVSPSRADGKFQGFEITAMKRSAAEAVAPQLVPGDIVTHINGVRMEKPDDYLNAWKLLGEVSKVRIDFIRDGEAKHAIWRVQ
ncbi:hypothetical protein FIV42_03090 [Persicimonas caeni]|uniref:PDZ domain-containing protein n=1 Tax=Persicimonas caeni TaxID=2292766 RepID=A0A4Y6PN74_PERCE|nr:hypothetical protein [Persicimonas caeni]QDG49756.1 hypothetical protein FIV42_03090 [Persicimonas caeni]QED30977.1 hypothetical protein FRD00_03085 [Persicimonas caeni]